ncbi:MAG: glycogen-binding domain-containing protein [Spirochaetia bacterium]|nr:glycogen-binding domain-containing protein [Spirochaetota bacterium]MDW8112156.1 glycogen-binding domain-containing protein [Spirochaetia bacterium]
MKRLLAIIIATSLAVSLISCAPAGAKKAGDKKSKDKKAAKAEGGKGPVKAGKIVFSFNANEYGGASSVNLVGSFNGWNPTDPNYAMEDPDGDGIFEIEVEWDSGKYIYKYYIDGNWPKDMSELEQYLSPKPNEYVDDGFGGKNAVLVVE